jgi:RND family efflux transporter MFP subunit
MEQPETAAPVQPITTAVTRGEVLHTVTAPGQLVGTGEMVLSFPVGGRLVELNARPGSVVQAGDVVARLDDQPYQEALTRAEVELAQAGAEQQYQLAQLQLAGEGSEAMVDQARAGFPSLTAAELHLQTAIEAEARAENEYNKAVNRPWEPADVTESYRLEWVAMQRHREIAEAQLQELHNQQWSVGEEVAARQSEVERLQGEASYLQANGLNPLLPLAVDEAQRQLQDSVLYAPFDGVVLEVAARPGETVAPGQSLLLLADPAAVEVRVTVIEEDLPLIHSGMAAELFFDAQPEAAVAGEVARIVPRRVPGEERPLYHVFLALAGESPAGVYAGMTADAAIISSSQTDVLRLPRALVRPGGDGTAVVEVWRQGQRQEREVTVGLRGDVYAEILSGLQEGDEVVAE